MSLMNVLHPHEIVMLGAGCLLLVVLMGLLVRQVSKDRPYTGLLLFFMIPLAMMGWPSIKAMEVRVDSIRIEKTTSALLEDPSNSELRKQLEEDVAKIASRPIVDPEIATRLARAQFELGHEAAAEATIDKVLEVEAQAAGPLEVQKQIQFFRNIRELTTTLDKLPQDPEALSNLKVAVLQMETTSSANVEALSLAAEAEYHVGNPTKAEELSAVVLQIDPSNMSARQLRERISRENRPRLN